jgi:transcriptional regulator with XRE-family HTH domain
MWVPCKNSVGRHGGVTKIAQPQAVCAEVVRRLRHERERRGFSNYAVSQRSGVSQSMLSLLERGHRNAALETLLKIADALEVDLDDVIRRARAAVGKDSSRRKATEKPGAASRGR